MKVRISQGRKGIFFYSFAPLCTYFIKVTGGRKNSEIGLTRYLQRRAKIVTVLPWDFLSFFLPPSVYSVQSHIKRLLMYSIYSPSDAES